MQTAACAKKYAHMHSMPLSAARLGRARNGAKPKSAELVDAKTNLRVS